jgi:uncharacterized membrane protein
MHTTLVIERPLQDLFAFCRDFENFPQIVDILLSVEDSQDGRSHWAVRSPKGDVVEWDATVTKYMPNSVIGWESVPGSAVYASGLMRFYPLTPAATRLDVAITYRPRRTALGEALQAIVAPSNSKRLKIELAHASQELSATLSNPPEPEAARVLPPEDAISTPER